MDIKIQSFIDSQKNLTLCTSVNDVPYCANCFYAFVSELNLLVFKSDKDTKHIQQAFANNKIAGTILPDIHKTGTIRGIQFSGKFVIPNNDILDKAKKKYYTNYPFALAISGDLWGIELLTIKMTDNTLGFGKKLLWEQKKEAIVENTKYDQS